jgi:hypothetical protein
MFQGTIAKRIAEAIKAKTAAAEKKYKEGCDAINTEAEGKKLTLADECVKEVVG